MNYYFIFILILLIDKNRISTILVCEIGPEGKCLHDLRNSLNQGFAKNDAGIISSHANKTFEWCKEECNENLICFMAGYNTSDSKCILYRNISFHDTWISNIKLYLYVCCDTKNGHDAGNRCPGFWKHKSLSQSDNVIRTKDPLIEFKGLNEYQCQMECLRNSICGAANIDYWRNCQLIIQFPVGSLKLVDNQYSGTYQWQCSSDYHLPTPSKDCRHRIGHNNGFWSIQNTSTTFTTKTKYLINFYTMDYRECLSNCALYRHCKMAWYSQEESYCILEGNDKATCAQISDDNYYNFTTYVWVSCHGHRMENTVSKRNEYPCRKLVSNNHTYIYPIECGHLSDRVSKPYPCWTTVADPQGTVFTDNLHCQIKQSFLVTNATAPVVGNFTNVSWTRVYTGYESLWLVNVSEINFPETSEEQCDIYDANMDVSNHPPPKIIKRTEWFAPKSRGPENPFPDHAVKYVIITDTEQPYCNCFSVEACSSIIRGIQMSIEDVYSIPYSFIVTGDGVVYEGRGWDFQPEVAQAHYNHNSFAIALCGRYIHSPGVTPLLSVKYLIKLAIELGKVSKNYTLYMYNDVMDRPYPYDGIRRVFELWPHYRGHTKEDCLVLSTVTILFNVFFIFLLFVVFVSTFHYLGQRLWHQTNCYLVKMCRIETIYCNLFNKSTEVLPHILVHNLRQLLNDNVCVSPITSPFFWIEDNEIMSQKDECVCQSAIFSILNFYQSKSQLVNLSTILLLPEISCCSRTLGFVFQRNEGLGKDSVLFLHFRRENSFIKFVYRLHQNQCLCDHFGITRYHFQYFVTELCYIVPIKGSESKRANDRGALQQQYSYKNESKIQVFYRS